MRTHDAYDTPQYRNWRFRQRLLPWLLIGAVVLVSVGLAAWIVLG